MEDQRRLAYISAKGAVYLYPEIMDAQILLQSCGMVRMPHLDEPLETYHQRLLDAKLKAVL